MPSGKGATITTAQVAANGTVGQLVAQNLSRVMLIVNNTGTSAAFVGLGSATTATNGFVVPAAGVVYFDNYCGPMWVITGGSAATVTVAQY